MAIVKEIKTNKGPVTYWVVGLIQLNNFSKDVHIKMFGFHDKEYADMENAVPADTVEINIRPDQYDELIGRTDIIKKAYEIFSESIVEADITYDFSKGVKG